MEEDRCITCTECRHTQKGLSHRLSLPSLPSLHVIKCVYLLYLICVCVLKGTEASNNRRSKHVLQYQIWEEAEKDTFVGNLATDARLNRLYNATVLNILTYTFISDDTQNFNLDERTGRLTTAAPIDRDIECPQEVDCILKLDVGIRPVDYFTILKLEISILDINDNSPAFPNPIIYNSISESTLPGVLFPVTPASDPDSPINGISSYVLRTPIENFQLQVRNNSDGSKDLQLLLKKMVNREIQDSYTLTVTAYDGGNPQLSGTLQIELVVTDVNDNNPSFNNKSYEVAVEETTPINSTLLTVKALDADSGNNGRITYGFNSRTQHAYGHIFGIDPTNGEIYLKSLLDAESLQSPSYTLTVTARDQGPDSLPTTVKVTIDVIDVNDHAPEISINVLKDVDYAEVPEDAEVPYFVAYISVFDPDHGENGIFNCSLDDTDDFSLVQLYEKEFKIDAISVFDREMKAEYRVMIVCEDQGEFAKTSVEELVVRIGDRNDHAPYFQDTMYIATLEENNNINAFIIQVSAVDSDSEANSRIEYHLGESVRKTLNIDAGTGVITAGISFDREETSSLDFRVTAIDQGMPPQTATAMVLLTILDQDDQIPHFKANLYSFDIEEDAEIGTEVGVVQAVDGDVDGNNEFQFTLLGSQDIRNTFAIDKISGIIKTLKVLDRETIDVYHVTAHVHSVTGQPSRMNDTAQVIIHITDVNDNAPVIDFPKLSNRTVGISNKVPVGHVVTQVLAHDDDFSRNGKITYFISEGNEDGAFAIGGKSGEIYVNDNIEDLDGQTYRLVIMAQDDGVPQRLTAAVMYIQINHTIPYFPPVGLTGNEDSGLSEINLIIIIAIVVGTFCIVVSIFVAIILMRRRDRCCRSSKCHNNSAGVMVTLPHNVKQSGVDQMDIIDKGECGPQYVNMNPPSYDSQTIGSQHSFKIVNLTENQVNANTTNVNNMNNAKNVKNLNNGNVANLNSVQMNGVVHQKGPHESDDDDMSVSNSGSDNSKAMDTLSPANGDKDTDSGCCADMSTNSNLEHGPGVYEEVDNRSPNGPHGSILKIKHHHHHPPGMRRIPVNSRQTSFTDWVLSENEQLRQTGSVYRVHQPEAGSSARSNKAVRFIDKSTPLNGTDDEADYPAPPPHSAQPSSSYHQQVAPMPAYHFVDSRSGSIPPPAPAPAPKGGRLTTFSAQRHSRGSGQVDTIPEEPESSLDYQNNLQFIPMHTMTTQDKRYGENGSLV